MRACYTRLSVTETGGPTIRDFVCYTGFSAIGRFASHGWMCRRLSRNLARFSALTKTIMEDEFDEDEEDIGERLLNAVPDEEQNEEGSEGNDIEEEEMDSPEDEGARNILSS